MNLYRRKPKFFIIVLFVLGTMLIGVSLTIKLHIPERIARIISESIETPQGTYIGDLDSGIVDGEGEFTWENDDYYVGEFDYNEIEGEGELINTEGDHYEGDFQEGVRSGYGEYKWANGNIYRGSWSNDKITGEGTITLTTGDTLEGFFNDGKFVSGVYTCEKATANYKIVFEDRKTTNVTIEYSDGTIYDGEYNNNGFNGEGTLTYSNGDEYIGEFVDGKKTGHGRYTWKNGSYYTGNWDNDKMEGEGTYFYPEDSDGYKLNGTFKNNRPHGKLDYYVSETKSYVTDWKNGKCIKLTV